MVDNRSAGFFGIGGGFNFKSGDISGTAAKTSDDKMGQGTEYFAQEERQEKEEKEEKFVDRSAQLRASLNSLAVMNSANIHLKKSQIKEAVEKQKESGKGSKKKRASKKALSISESDSERE